MITDVAQGTRGTVAITGGGAGLTYQPNADVFGTDSFTYTIGDGNGGSATATVTVAVTPVNDSPEGDAQAVATDEDLPLAITLTGSDVDNDPLSFSVVAGLLCFTGPVRLWLWPATGPGGMALGRWGPVFRLVANYVSVSLVAFLVAWPLVAYHFQMISPLAVGVSLVTLPLVTGVLAVGYFKVVVGLMLPGVGALLAGVLVWLAGLVTGLVGWVSAWPIASVRLQGQPTWVWLVGAMSVTAALLGGWFGRRRLALAASIGLCMLGLTDWPAAVVTNGLVRSRQPAVTLNMFAVGNGSCYLVRIGHRQPQAVSDAATSDGNRQGPSSPGGVYVLMFDCGSQSYTDVGTRRIVPALNHLRVRHIDALVVSHADMDHFNGSLGVVDLVGVGRVFMPRQMLALAQERPDSAVGFFVDALRKRRVPFEAIGRGWHRAHGSGRLEMLWPPPDLVPAAVNDTSLVLSVTAAGRRVILNGDIGQHAITSLLDAGVDLRSDVCDLPHHGSFVVASPAWLGAVDPVVVLQSSGPGRLRTDKWAGLMQERSAIQRLISHHRGMVELTIGHDGQMAWTTFKNPTR